jgi:multisubunit Na+/H+ antiporter MnhF subunit
VGILLFLLFLANVFKLVRKHQVQARLLGMMTITTVLALYFVTFIVSGWFNMEFLLTILILGGFIYYLQEHEQTV